MRHPLLRTVGGLLVFVLGGAQAVAQYGIYAPANSALATPLPPGPGGIPQTFPAAPLAAPVLLPAGAPTAAPVVGHQAPACASGCESARGRRFFASADFLYGATQGLFLPPLVTAAPGTAPVGTAGALFNPNTTVAFGGRRDLNSMRPGFMLNVGYWCDDTPTWGVDAGFFFLGGLSERFSGFSGPGGVILARPVVNGLTATNVGVPVAGPVLGGITASADTSFIGADANWRKALLCGECFRADLLVGYRYLHLGDSVDVWQTSGVAPGVLPVESPLTHDSFRTRNAFHGPQVGLVSDLELRWGLHIGVVTKVALGVTVAEANTDGTSTLAGGAVPVGLLVGPTNRGERTDTYFAVVPEGGLRLGYDVTPNVRLTMGYTFLYWSQVRRAADQIDLTVLAPGRPAFRNETTDVWMQAWTVGLAVGF